MMSLYDTDSLGLSTTAPIAGSSRVSPGLDRREGGHTTVRVPCILGWSEHVNWYVPGPRSGMPATS